MARYAVSYDIRPRSDRSTVLHSDTVVVEAADATRARDEARAWVYAHDAHFDERVDPCITIRSVERAAQSHLVAA